VEDALCPHLDQAVYGWYLGDEKEYTEVGVGYYAFGAHELAADGVHEQGAE
jgi:hypothetical protein